MFKSETPTEREKLSNYGEMSAPPPGQKKHRLSRLLGGSKDKDLRDHPDRRATNYNSDSAYASDNTNVTNTDVVHVENDGTIPNTRRDQNLALDRGTGEVFDEDTGEVVTVVTTTTTTTTTTTSKGGQQRQDVVRDVQTTQQEQPYGVGSTVTTGEAYRDSGYGSGLPPQAHGVSGLPKHSDSFRDSTYGSGVGHYADRDRAYASGGLPTQGSIAPDVPTRNSRRSGEYDPTSPSRHNNFSYPSRTAPGVPPTPPQGYPTETGYSPATETTAKKTGRFADLKAAAIGLHGVGETLRGTLNSTIDDRFQRQNAEKAAATRAKNEAVLARGRNEMSGLPRRDRQGLPVDDPAYVAQPGYSTQSSYSYQPSNNPLSHNNSVSQNNPLSHNDSVSHNNPLSHTQSSYNDPLSRNDTLTSNNPLSPNTTGTYNSVVSPNTTSTHNNPLSHNTGTYNTVGTSGNPLSRHNDSTNAGPHSSNIANKLDPRADSDRDHRNDHNSALGSTTGGGEYSGQTYSGSTNAGPHSSNMANVLDPRVDSDRSKEYRNNPTSTYGSTPGQTYAGSTNTGPHNSNVANRLDPRVDNDKERDYRNEPTSTYGSATGPNYSGSTSVGPHSNNVANKLDPRVDDDRDNRNISTYGSTPGQTYSGSNTAGPHNSNVANKLDPRVDSDRSDRDYRNNPTSTYGSTTGQNYNRSSSTGPHNSNLANKLDPRVESDKDRIERERRNDPSSTYGSTSGHGYSGQNYSGPNTTEPHNSNIANKLDPRVESDKDRIERERRNDPTSTYGSTSGTGYSGQNYSGSNTTAPHNSNLANKLDPRVESDKDRIERERRNDPTSTYGSTSAGGYTSQNNPGSTTTGPHNSNLANKLDSRVDSDRDRTDRDRRNDSTYGMTSGSGYNAQNYSGSNTTAPHNSNLANKLDPRVESDKDRIERERRNDNTYGTTGGSGYAGQNYSGSNTTAPHNSNLANKLDPRVESDKDRTDRLERERRNDSTYGTTGGSGYTGQDYSKSTNTGPHNSNMMNKLDPRVDSDNDNRNNPSSRVGGYGTQDNSYNQPESSIIDSDGKIKSNRRSVAFEDEQPRATTLAHQDSSVSALTTSSGVANTPGEGLHVPPRGSAIRGNSGYAPESISGNVERVPTLPSQRQGRTDPADEYYSSADENGLRKQGTLSKLFKRKPVNATGTTPTQSGTGEERKKYF